MTTSLDFPVNVVTSSKNFTSAINDLGFLDEGVGLTIEDGAFSIEGKNNSMAGKIDFTTEIDAFLAHKGPKASYGKQPLGNELFFQSHGLLTQQCCTQQQQGRRHWNQS